MPGYDVPVSVVESGGPLMQPWYRRRRLLLILMCDLRSSFRLSTVALLYPQGSNPTSKLPDRFHFQQRRQSASLLTSIISCCRGGASIYLAILISVGLVKPATPIQTPKSVDIAYAFCTVGYACNLLLSLFRLYEPSLSPP
jgi:hypothetical protein